MAAEKISSLAFGKMAKSTITNMAMVRNCNVISENINVRKSVLNKFLAKE
jgi:hypothetical protein